MASIDEAKEYQKKFLEEMAVKLKQTLNSEDFKNWCESCGKLYQNNYSYKNSMLVMMQKPSASYVMGYQTWKTYGRQVSKGATPMKVLLPVMAYESKKGDLFGFIKKNLQNNLKEGMSHSEFQIGVSNLYFTLQPNGLMGMKLKGNKINLFPSQEKAKQWIDRNIVGKVPMYFKLQNVFDIEDTYKPEFLWVKESILKREGLKPEKDENKKIIKNGRGEIKCKNTLKNKLKLKEHKIEGEIDKNTKKALEEILRKKGIKLGKLEKHIEADGVYNRETNEIKIKELPDNEYVSVLLHEMAHSIMHHKDADESKSSRDKKEVQAEAVAYIVGNELGLDTETSSFEYMASWSDIEIENFKESLEVIWKAAKELSLQIKEELSKYKEVNKEEIKTEVKKSIEILEESKEKQDELLSEINNAHGEEERDLIEEQINNEVKKVEKASIICNEAMKNDPSHEKIKNFYQGLEHNIEIERKIEEKRYDMESDQIKKMAIETPLEAYQYLGFDLNKARELENSRLVQLPDENNKKEVIVQAENYIAIKKRVASKKGVAIEVLRAEDWTGNEVLKEQSIYHPKLFLKKAEEVKKEIKALQQSEEQAPIYSKIAINIIFEDKSISKNIRIQKDTNIKECLKNIVKNNQEQLKQFNGSLSERPRQNKVEKIQKIKKFEYSVKKQTEEQVEKNSAPAFTRKSFDSFQNVQKKESNSSYKTNKHKGEER